MPRNRYWREDTAARVRAEGNALLASWGELPDRAPCPTCQRWLDLYADGLGRCPAHGDYRIKRRWGQR